MLRKLTTIILAAAIGTAVITPAAGAADLLVLSEPEGQEVYSGVKLLGRTPLLLEDCRPGEMTLKLAGGKDFALAVPDDDRTVTVVLTTPRKKGFGALGTTGKWVFMGGVVGGIITIFILAEKHKEE